MVGPVAEGQAQPVGQIGQRQGRAGQIAARGPRRDHRMPALQRVARFARCRHDQPAFRPRHGDVKQAPALFLLPPFPIAHGHGHRIAAFRRIAAPDRHPVQIDDPPARRRAALLRLGQKDDGAFQTLGAMHRHHPDQPARPRGKLPLDLDLVALQPDEEPGQRGRLDLFIGQRLRQKLVDPVLGLGAKAGQQRRAPAMPGQKPRDQVMRAQEIRLRGQIVQHLARALMRGMAQPRPQEFAPPPRRQPIEIILGQPEQRRAQGGGQRQIVLGRGQNRQGGSDVAHGQLGGQLQPVGPRHGQVRGLQRPDQRVEQPPAPLDQDLDVARPDRARLAGLGVQDRAAQHRADLAGDGAGQHHLGVVFGRRIDGAGPVALFGLFGGGDGRPQIDAPRQTRAKGDVARLIAQTLRGLGLKDRIDQPQDRGRGPEAVRQPALLHRRLRLVKGGVEPVAHILEDGDVGALEGIDRLLGIAHHEQRAGPVLRARAAGEFVGQAADHPPLAGAGILRLVHQDVVDPAIQPPQHPLRHAGFLQQRGRPADQVVEIQPAMRGLLGLHPQGEGMAEAVQRQRAFGGGQRVHQRAGQFDPDHQIFQIGHQRGAGARAQILGRDRAGLGGKGRLGGGAEQEAARQDRQIGKARIAPSALRQLLGQLGIGGFARPQQGQQRVHQIALGSREDLRQQRVGGQAGRQVQRVPDRRRVGRVCVIGCRQPGQKPVDPLARMQPRQVRDGRIAGLGHFLQNPGAQGAGAAVVQFREPHRHAGLQRKAPQKRRAEAVDRLHLQPAGRLDRAGEKTPRLGQIGGAPLAKRGQFGAQSGFGQHRPFPQPRQQAVLHLGRGGLGIGQAQDAFGRRAGQQQPRHAVGQHPRLARPGIRRQPCGPQRVRRRDLVAGRVIHDRPPSAARRHRLAPIRHSAPDGRNRPQRTRSRARAWR